ncbi:MAG: hypothetical protein HUU01_02655 [Saprospiraceae bacterium]|nr:hypothetical protein [Saprospiraceae bacterium]
MSPTPNAAYLRYAPLFLGIGILAVCGQVGLMLLETEEAPSASNPQVSWMWALFFMAVDVLFWGVFWWTIAQTTGHLHLAREAFFVSGAIVFLHFGFVFFAAPPPSWNIFLNVLKAIPVGLFCWRAYGGNDQKAAMGIALMTALLIFSHSALASGAHSLGTILSRFAKILNFDNFGFIKVPTGEGYFRMIPVLGRFYLVFWYVLLYALLSHWIQKIASGRSLLSTRRLDLAQESSRRTATVVFYAFRYSMLCFILGFPDIMSFALSSAVPESFRRGVLFSIFLLACVLVGLFFAAQFLRSFLLEYFIQRGYPHPNASVFFLSIPVLDFILWPFIALPVWPVNPPKKRLETFIAFQSRTGPNDLKVILLILNAIFLFFSFRTTNGDDMIFSVLGFALTAFYLFHPAGLNVFIVVQLFFTGILLFLAFKAGNNGGEINYSRHIIQGLMTLVYAFLLYGILHPQRMEAELEVEAGDGDPT